MIDKHDLCCEGRRTIKEYRNDNKRPEHLTFVMSPEYGDLSTALNILKGREELFRAQGHIECADWISAVRRNLPNTV